MIPKSKKKPGSKFLVAEFAVPDTSNLFYIITTQFPLALSSDAATDEILLITYMIYYLSKKYLTTYVHGQ